MLVGCSTCLGIAGGILWAAVSQTIVQASIPGGGIAFEFVVIAAMVGGVQGFGGGVVAAGAAIAVVAVADPRLRLRAWLRALVVGAAVALAIVGYMAWLTHYSWSITTPATIVGPALVFGVAATLSFLWWGNPASESSVSVAQPAIRNRN